MAVSFLMKVKNQAGQPARCTEFLVDYEFTSSHRKGPSNANADGLSSVPPCAEDDGVSCKQCQKRVIGKHDVKVIQTTSCSHVEQSKFGVDVLPQSCDVGVTSSRFERPDCTQHEKKLSGRPGSESVHGSGRRKFGPSRK